MDILTFSQILFNFIASIAILVVGAMLALALFYFLKTAKNISEMSEKINSASEEIKSKISAFFEKLAEMPILNLFKKRREKKGRKTT